MDKENIPDTAEQITPAAEELEKKRFKKFLDRLTIFHTTPKLTIRVWLAWSGVILFIALVIAYYVVNGG